MKELLERLANNEATVEEVLTQIEADAKDKVPRSRLNDKNDEIKELKLQLTQRDEQLESIKEQVKGTEELTASIQSLQEENASIKSEYEAKLLQRDFDAILDGALRDAKAKNPKAVKALLDINLDAYKDGEITGLEEQIKNLKTSEDYLFESDGLKGRAPVQTPGGTKKTAVTKEQFAEMSYAERSQLYTDSPELYKQLNQ